MVIGYSGANSSSERMAQNEAMLSDLFEGLAVLGKVPILLMGDFNVKLESSCAIQGPSGSILASCVLLPRGRLNLTQRVLFDRPAQEPALMAFSLTRLPGICLERLGF